MNKIQALGLFFFLGLLLFIGGVGRAKQPQNEYSLQIKIGDHVSTISNQLSLDYTGELNGYQVQLRGDISKDYRFVEGIKKSPELGYDNYKIAISKGKSKVGLGMVAPEDKFSRIIPGEVFGSTININSYQLWGGYSVSRNLFSADNNKQLGFSYSGQKQKAAYQLWQETTEEEIYNQYLNYKREINIFNSDLYSSTTGAVNLTDELVGIKSKLRYSSKFKELPYTLISNYKSPEFQAVDSPSDVGYGSYQVSGQVYYSLPAALISFNSKYKRNNLNQGLEETTRNIDNNLQVSYYGSSGAEYSLDFDYDLQFSYDLQEQVVAEETDNLGLKLGYELEDFSTYLQYKQAGSSDKEILSMRVDYNKVPYQISGRQKWIRESGKLKREWNINGKYKKQIFDRVNYSLVTDLEGQEKMKLGIKQSLGFNLGDAHQLSTALDLNKYLSAEGINKQLYINYKYKF